MIYNWQNNVYLMLQGNSPAEEIRDYLQKYIDDRDNAYIQKVEEIRQKLECILCDYLDLLNVNEDYGNKIIDTLDIIEYNALKHNSASQIDDGEDYMDRLRLFADSL